MGYFKSDSSDGNRGRSGGRSGGFGGGRGGRSGGFGGRDSGDRGGFRGGRDREGGFERRRPQMFEVTCDKCKKLCEVPFRPSSGKPVFCSECFRQEGDSGSSRSNFDSRSSNNNSGAQPGITQEQFKQLNSKLDKILEFLGKIEFEEEMEEAEESEEEDEEESEK